MADNKVTKSGEQGGKAITVKISGESKEEAFQQWTERMTELNQNENVKGFKRIEDDSGTQYNINGEVYVEEE